MGVAERVDPLGDLLMELELRSSGHYRINAIIAQERSYELG
jgi:hypothetical protein